jgi:hypothetical protein
LLYSKMSHVRTTLRSYRVRNPAEFPLLVRRLAEDHRSGEQFLADRLDVSSDRLGVVPDRLRLGAPGFNSLLSELLRPAREPDVHETIVRHRLLDELIRYLAAHPSRRPDTDLLPLERLAERIRETRLRPGIELQEATEETILDLTDSLFHYYDLLSPEEVEMGVEDVGVEEEEKDEVVKRTRLLDEISRLIKRRPDRPSRPFVKRPRPMQTAMTGTLDDSL